MAGIFEKRASVYQMRRLICTYESTKHLFLSKALYQFLSSHIYLNIPCTWSPLEWVCIKCQSLFPGKNNLETICIECQCVFTGKQIFPIVVGLSSAVFATILVLVKSTAFKLETQVTVLCTPSSVPHVSRVFSDMIARAVKSTSH